MGTDGLRFRQVVVVDEHEGDDESLSSRAAISPPASASDLLTPLNLGCSLARASTRGPHLTPPSPHSPSDSSSNRHESAIPVNDGYQEEHNCPSPLNPLSPPTTSSSGLGPGVCDGALGPSAGLPSSRGSLDPSVGQATGDHLSPYDATIEERQRIFGHNVLLPCTGGGYPSETYILLKEITSAIVSTSRPSIHSDLSV